VNVGSGCRVVFLVFWGGLDCLLLRQFLICVWEPFSFVWRIEVCLEW